jgi:hypothetical protein
MKSSKSKKSERKDNSSVPTRSLRNYVIWAVIILGVVVLAALTNRSKPARPANSGSVSSPAQAISTNAPAGPAPAPANFQKLTGKWLRPDGGYVLEIKSVEDSGKLRAAYFNPQPINVSKAEASQAGAATRVFIELRDVNYPGSTYTLTYLPEKDLLVGIYYQALQQQRFEVYFERMK